MTSSPLSSIRTRITEFFAYGTNTIASRVRTYTRRWRSTWRTPTNDWARSDYAFWNRIYLGHAVGLELSGLLIKPLVGKLAAWTLGRAPHWKLDSESSQQALADWWSQWHPEILRAFRASLKQGDAFVVINSDLSLTLLPPDSVDPIVAEDDYSVIIGWRVTQTMAHPDTTARMSVVDEYYADRRVHRVERDTMAVEETTYPNLLGRLQIVHIANQPSDGETFGHAEAEALLGVMHKYGEVFDAAIEGNVLQGRPTPVVTFETVQDLDRFANDYGTTVSTALPNGQTERTVSYDIDLSQVMALSGATFEYKGPGSFTGDTVQLLGVMFYLILQHSELPEFVFGNAISSSKASAETQLPVFIEFVKMRRGEMVGWLTEIVEIALGYLALMTPGVALVTPVLQWEALDQEDGALTLAAIQWAFTEGLLDRRTALTLMPVEIEDPDAVLDAAKAEAEERAAMFPETGSTMGADEQQFDQDLRDEIENLEI